MLQSNLINGWLYQQMSAHNIKVDYDFTKADNLAWVNLQLAKMPSPQSAESNTSTTTGVISTKPVTSAAPRVNYTFGIYSDAACTVPITPESIIDWGLVQQGTITDKTIYVKNLGDESSEPVILAGMDMSTDLGLLGKQVTLTDGSVETVSLSLGAAAKASVGTHSFTIMCSRGTLTVGYSLFIPGQVSITAAPPTTATSATTTMTTPETTSTTITVTTTTEPAATTTEPATTTTTATP